MISIIGSGCEPLLWNRMMKDYPNIAWCENELSSATKPMSLIESNIDCFNEWKCRKGSWSNEELNEIRNYKSNEKDKISNWSVSESNNPTPLSSNPLKVGLLGARGYVGREFAKLLVEHPDLELKYASSRALNGQRVIPSFGLPESACNHGVASDLLFTSIEPEEFVDITRNNLVDIWVLALPNGLAPGFTDLVAKECPDSSCLFIDLGADFRFNDTWTYGLPERPGARKNLSSTKRISNPGCYATGTQVALLPLLNGKSNLSDIKSVNNIPPTVFGVSGYSGAGTTPSPKNDPKELNDNLMAYTLTNHIHERECSRHLGRQIGFTPHVAPFFQGIHLTVSCNLERNSNGIYPTSDQVYELYKEYFKDDKLIDVVNDMPHVRDIMFQHQVRVGGFNVDENTGRLVMVSLIDNLLKGAATQALQNINIALGKDEYLGIIN